MNVCTFVKYERWSFWCSMSKLAGVNQLLIISTLYNNVYESMRLCVIYTLNRYGRTHARILHTYARTYMKCNTTRYANHCFRWCITVVAKPWPRRMMPRSDRHHHHMFPFNLCQLPCLSNSCKSRIIHVTR